MRRLSKVLLRPILLVGILCVPIIGPFTPLAAAGIIPPERRTVWNPGIPGGVPARTTVCATINAFTYGDGSQDATPSIQAAVDACPAGQVVQLSAGDFKINSHILVHKGITLRGQGPSLTKLKMPSGTSENLITIGSDQWIGFFQSTNLATNGVKGNKNLMLVSNPGLEVGEIVLIDQVTDPALISWGSQCPPGDPCRTWFTRPDRPIGQMMEIAAINGNTITFTTPFHIDFKTSLDAQLSRLGEDWRGVVPAVKYAGVEDLYLSGGSSGGQGNIKMEKAAYSWIKNIESDYHNGHSVGLYGTFRSVVRDSYIHSAQESVPGGGAYGLAISLYSSDNLIENNIVWRMNKVMVMQASGGGNVIAYNYMEDGLIEYSLTWMESGINASHMAGSHYELFEGNQSFNYDAENTWGSPIYITAFRNHLTDKRRSVAPLQFPYDDYRRAVSLSAGAWWHTLVGNVLGYDGMSPAPAASFTYEDFYPWGDDPVGMWKVGIGDNWGPADSKVVSTLIRGGNFDYATNQVHWEDIAEQPLPDSLYLPSKPAFFGSYTWPWVDPTGATKVFTLPARVRFDAGGAPTDTTPPTVPTDLTATVISPTQIDLSWTASTDDVGVTGYSIYRNGKEIGTTADTFFQSTGLKASTSYSYRVAAYDGAGNKSAKSVAVTKTTQPVPSTKFTMGDRVKTIEKANVRSAPSRSGTVLGTQQKTAAGTVVGGPWYWNLRWWWKIDFDDGMDGWVAQGKLRKVVP